MSHTPGDENGMKRGGIPPGYICELMALRRLLKDVDSLPLHAHKRAVVREWIETHMKQVRADARAAQTDKPSDAGDSPSSHPESNLTKGA